MREDVQILEALQFMNWKAIEVSKRRFGSWLEKSREEIRQEPSRYK